MWNDPLEGGHKNGLTYLTACLESHHPIDLVVLMLGTNDLKARFSLTALDISLGAERLVQTIQKSGWEPRGNAPAILLAAPPPVDPKDDAAEMFARSKEKSVDLARRYVEVAALWVRPIGCRQGHRRRSVGWHPLQQGKRIENSGWRWRAE